MIFYHNNNLYKQKEGFHKFICGAWIKLRDSVEDVKKEFRHIEESVLKSYFDRIIRTQNNYLYDEISNR